MLKWFQVKRATHVLVLINSKVLYFKALLSELSLSNPLFMHLLILTATRTFLL
jgi:hypothetical protein